MRLIKVSNSNNVVYDTFYAVIMCKIGVRGFINWLYAEY